ncbi:MAG: fibronectin type III domain-containing protein, partial [Saprospiraceae bacterium]
MNSTLLRFFCLTLFYAGLYRAEAQCQYQLDMFDSFGDGWNGGTLKITAGPNTYVFTLDNFNDDGIDSTLYFDVTAGLPLLVFWSPGAFVNEVAFKLYNNDGTLVYQSGMLTSSPAILYSTIAACPSCLKPSNVKIENVYDTRAKLRWSPAPASDVLGWQVIYGPQGFVPGPGVGDTAYVATPKVTLTGLQKKTFYDFYVVQQCDTTDFSVKVGPFSFETYWTNDVGISAVLTPASSCDLGQEAIKIVLTNYGAAPQTLLPFRYSVNGLDGGVQQPEDGFYTGVLGKDSSTVIEFETSYDFSAPGEYLIAVYTQLVGDEEPWNDTIFYRINNRLLVPYQQNFETWDGGWYVDTSSVSPSWAFGDPEKFDLDTAASGVNAWVTNLTGFYNGSEKSYLHSPCFDFSGLTTDPSIQFSLFYSTEQDYDGGWLEISLDGGDVWEKVGMKGEGLNWYTNTNTELDLGDVWDGASGGWIKAQHRLPGTAGMSEVRLRFAFQADNFLSYSGLGVDD